MKIKTALIILFLFLTTTGLVSVSFAQPLDPSNNSVVVSANINVDLYSTVTVTPNTVEIYQPAIVEVRVLSSGGVGIAGRQIVIYGSGLNIVQPLSLTDATGRTSGSVSASVPGTYTVCAKDTTFGYDIFIQSCKTLYVVPVPVPNMLAEPQYTKDFSNMVMWDSLGPNYKYTVQVSEYSDFSVLKAQATQISATSFNFTNLENEKMYFYRVRAHNAYGGVSAWSNVVYSVQDAQSPVVEVLDMGDIGENTTTSWESNYELTFLIRVKDNLQINEAKFYCLNSEQSLVTCTTNYNLEGELMTVKIRLGDLERVSDTYLKERYKFCVEATDSAGNLTRFCDISLVIPVEEVRPPDKPTPPVPPVPSIIDRVEKVIDDITVILDDTVGKLDAKDLERVTTATSVVTATSAVVVAAGTLASMPYFLLQFLLNILSLFGFRKGAKPVGYVYDAVSKEPISQAIVRIFTEENRMVWTDVTDSKGYFTAKLTDGRYRIEARAARYVFPSKVVFGSEDPPITNVYHGDFFDIKSDTEINFAIPMDPLEVSELRIKLEAFWTRTKFLVHLLHVLLFLVGITLAFYTYYSQPSTLSLLVLLLFVPTFFLILRNIFFSRDIYGIVKDTDGNRLEGISVALREAEFDKIIAKRVTDAHGRYRFFVGEGRYYVEILDPTYIVEDIKGGNEVFAKKEILITKDIVLKV
ncbi:MAG: hypothetical protein ACOX0X_00695 [Candidatus Dojkabacteria bacterium]